MEALLAGVEPGDAPTFAAAAALCLLMTVSGRSSPPCAPCAWTR